MPSQRRFRVIIYLVLAGVVTLFFMTRGAREPDTQAIADFYHKTANAMHRADAGAEKAVAGHGVDADGDVGANDNDDDDDDDVLAKQMAERLKEAEKQAKDSARAKGPNKPDVPEAVIGVGSSASGQERGAAGSRVTAQDADEKEVTPEEDRAIEAELDSIFKKSPVIIFSKSYCPYSKRAKGILLEKYVIEPTPHVVELDLHPLGPKIQARLGEMTGRKTVPNIMVYGRSIGGGDEVTEMDKEKTLAEKITSIGQNRIAVSERFIESRQKAG
ncbi:hypothetical protein VTK26DRAFT_7022 [Humicola hyalothermophila]